VVRICVMFVIVIYKQVIMLSARANVASHYFVGTNIMTLTVNGSCK
jgi:hypothetical protein